MRASERKTASGWVIRASELTAGPLELVVLSYCLLDCYRYLIVPLAITPL